MIVRNFIALSTAFALLRVFSYAQVWSDIGGGTNNTVNALGLYNGELYVSGNFNKAGSIFATNIAKWNGVHWDSVGLGFDPMWGGQINDFCVINGDLVAGGLFIGLYSGLPFPNNFIPNTYDIANWDNIQWTSEGASSSNTSSGSTSIEAIALYNGELYIGGNLTKIGGVNINRIAKWNGTGWSDVAGGITGGFGLISCMAVYNGELYVGGDFSYAGGKTTPYIARWNGTIWDSVGGGFNDVVVSMTVDTIANILYVGGSFTMTGNTNTKYVAQWNGNDWRAIGNPITNGATVMVMYHGQLYVGCQSTFGLSTDTTIAYWNGSNWNQIVGPNNTPTCFKVFKDTLFVGGYFDSINGIPMNYIAGYYSDNVGIYENEMEGSFFKIYPNPSKCEITVEINTLRDQISGIRVYNMEGKLEKEVDGKQFIINKNKILLNVQTLSKGTYFIELMDKAQVRCYSQKFVLE